MRCPPPKHHATDHVMLSNANKSFLKGKARAALAKTYSDVKDNEQMKPTIQQSSKIEKG